MTYMLIIILAPLLVPSQIPHTIFNIISLSVDAVLCRGGFLVFYTFGFYDYDYDYDFMII